ncbi:MAG: PepSY domain-containing protein [Methylococcales bacterium]|nr:PepSY domain-containing protein [Methylococcales bacterium]
MKSTSKIEISLINLLLVFLFSSNCLATDENAPNQTRIDLDQATKLIIKDAQNRVLGAETELIDNREVHIIKVLTPDGRIRHYKIDAETGELINR